MSRLIVSTCSGPCFNLPQRRGKLKQYTYCIIFAVPNMFLVLCAVFIQLYIVLHKSKNGLYRQIDKTQYTNRHRTTCHCISSSGLKLERLFEYFIKTKYLLMCHCRKMTIFFSLFTPYFSL